MKNRIEYVFTSGYTAQGYYSYLPTLLNQLKRIILLQGTPGSGRSTFIKKIGLNLAERRYQVQFWPSPLDASYMEGVYLPQLETAIINEDATGDIQVEDYPEIVVHNIDLRDYYNQQDLAGSEEEIAALTDQLETIMGRVKLDLKEVQKSRKQLANHYENLLNAEKIRVLSQQLITEILGEGERVTHHFARAITSEGVVDFFEEITGNCTRRYILEGPPGCGKSWLMRRIGEEAVSQGHKVGFYHSGLDPDSLEMVVLKSLNIALADSDIVRAANRPGDRYISLLECSNGHEALYAQPETREVERLVSNRLYQVIEGLTRARQVEQKLSKLFTKAMKFDQVDARRDELIMEILQMNDLGDSHK